mmetsp:Transcript_44403/g.96495  ORF Transcript_44403/g.96495 Transcript_44403/m.96495 type:complete len:521 (+) Transcript_44403:44-1606(+)
MAAVSAAAHDQSYAGVALMMETRWCAVGIFRFLYCLTVAAVISMHHARHADFYSWFRSCGLPQAERRGLGYAACKPYGLWEPPQLTVKQFHAVGFALVVSLLLACVDSGAPRFFIWCAFGLYFLYFPQLFCESKAGGHSTLMIPTALFILGLTAADNDAAWPIEVLKVFLSLAYCASGVCKLSGSVYFKRFWGNGPTLQCYIYEAMWSRPGRHPLVSWAQDFLVRSPNLCTVAGVASLIFEAGFPAVLLLPRWCAVVVGAGVPLAFHGGIELLMGLDFLSYWCPILFIFLAEDAAVFANAVSAGREWFPAAASAILEPRTNTATALIEGLNSEPVVVAIALTYVLAQVLVSFSFRDILGEEKLPFSCCPMFFFPRNLFSRTPKLFCLSGANWRKPGYLDCSWMYTPAFPPPFELTEEDLSRLQYPVLTFGTLAPMPEDLVHRVKEEYRNRSFVLFTNSNISADLLRNIEELMEELTGKDEDAWCQGKLARVLEKQRTIRALFAEGGTMDAVPAEVRNKAE